MERMVELRICIVRQAEPPARNERPRALGSRYALAVSPRVLLLNPPGQARYLRDHWCSHVSKGRYAWQPYDLLALSGALDGHAELRALDAIAEGLDLDRSLQRVLAADPQVVVAMSGAVSWREDVAFFAELRARLPGLRIVVSGEWWKLQPVARLDSQPEVDAIVLDFTDCSVVALVRGLAAGLAGPDGGVPRNIAFRTPTGSRAYPVRGTGRFALGRLRHDLFGLQRYSVPQARRRPLGSVMGVLSCPWACRFCRFERIPHRLRDIGDLLDDLDHLAELGARELWWKDQTFGAPRAHGEAILHGMVDRGHGFSWSCETRPDIVTPRMLDKLRAAGCHTLLLGVEAASDDVLARANKGYDTAQVRAGFAAARAAGMRTLAHLALGLPGETPGTLAALDDLLDDLDPDFISVNIATPMVGTSFREQAEAEGWIDPALTMLDTSMSHPAARLPGVTPDQLWAARRRILRRFYLRPRWVARRTVDLRSPDEALGLAREGARFVTRGLRGRNQSG